MDKPSGRWGRCGCRWWTTRSWLACHVQWGAGWWRRERVAEAVLGLGRAKRRLCLCLCLVVWLELLRRQLKDILVVYSTLPCACSTDDLSTSASAVPLSLGPLHSLLLLLEAAVVLRVAMLRGIRGRPDILWRKMRLRRAGVGVVLVVVLVVLGAWMLRK